MNKPGADRVRWFLGDATTLPPTAVDMAVMTGNVAQVFVEDDDWSATLVAIRTALRPGGRLVFESRDPRREAWHRWTPSRSRRCIDIAGVGIVESWVDLLDVQHETVSFRWTYVFQSDGSVLTSDSMLRFRPRAALTDRSTGPVTRLTRFGMHRTDPGKNSFTSHGVPTDTARNRLVAWAGARPWLQHHPLPTVDEFSGGVEVTGVARSFVDDVEHDGTKVLQPERRRTCPPATPLVTHRLPSHR